MKKLALLFALSFVVIVVSVSILSHFNRTYKDLERGTYRKITDNYEISYNKDLLKIKKIDPDTKEGIIVYSVWTFLPAGQFDKYKKQFMTGASYDIN